jgi:hypothetical protein
LAPAATRSVTSSDAANAQSVLLMPSTCLIAVSKGALLVSSKRRTKPTTLVFEMFPALVGHRLCGTEAPRTPPVVGSPPAAAKPRPCAFGQGRPSRSPLGS